MSKNYTWEDVPNILSSISWQLKCIAETLDSINKQEKINTEPVTLDQTSSKLRDLLQK